MGTNTILINKENNYLSFNFSLRGFRFLLPPNMGRHPGRQEEMRCLVSRPTTTMRQDNEGRLQAGAENKETSTEANRPATTGSTHKILQTTTPSGGGTGLRRVQSQTVLCPRQNNTLAEGEGVSATKIISN